MNSHAQFDLHPDAEALNGFVENELPAAERTEVLAHMAGCARCREVVFLAQKAAGVDDGPKVLAPAAAARRPDRPRFRFWMWGWAGAAAMACVVGIALFVRAGHNVEPLRIAKAVPSEAPAQASAFHQASRAVAKPEAAAGKQAQPAGAIAETQQSEVRQTADESAKAAPATVSPAKAPPQTVAMDSLAMANAEAKSLQAPAVPEQPETRAVVPGNRMHGPAVSQQNQLQNFAANESIALPPANAPTPAGAAARPGSVAPVPANSSAVHGDVAAQSATQTVAVEADSAKLETMHNTQFMSLPGGEGNGLALKKSGLLMLPSGLPLVSTAAAGTTMVAIDAMGATYLSHDLGKKWEPVHPQWTGKAVKVRLAQPAGQGNAAGLLKTQRKDKRAKDSAAVAAVFEIVNDSNAVWSSADGKAWSPE